MFLDWFNSFVGNMFNTADFPPRWRCGVWSEPHGWMHIVSDIVIGLSYFCVPFIIAYFVSKRKDIPFPKFLFLFAVVFAACGFTHLMEAAIFYWPAYRFLGVLKLLAGFTSILMIIAIIPLVKKAIKLRSPEELEREIQMREALEERFRLCIEGSNDGLWDWDIKTNEVWYSNQFKKHLGYKEEEFPNRFESWSNTLHPEDHQPVMDALEAHIQKNVAYDIEYRCKVKGKSYKWFRARGRSLRTDSGEAYRMAGSIQDISNIKQAQDAFVASKAQYESLVQNIPGITYRCLLDKDWTMVYMSDQVKNLTGYAKEEFISNKRTFASLIHPEDVDFVDQVVNKAVQENSPWELEYRVITNEKKIKWVYEKGQAVKRDQNVTEYLDGFILDVSLRKQVEKEKEEYAARLVKETENAKEASRAKSEFLANMSHELRTPLNGIIGISEMILDSKSVPDIHQHADTVLAESEFLLGLLNEILDHAKIEANKISIESITFNLHVLLKHLSSSLKKLVEKKGLELIVAVDEKAPSYLRGDSLRIKQILSNLAGNAIKFTEKGWIKIGVAVLEEVDSKAKLRFTVSDTGIGIPEEKQTKIFDKFTQADESTTRKYGGTGLGLSIVKRLVELMGGEIGIDSKEGEGSTFWFTLSLSLSKKEDLVLAPGDDYKEVKGVSKVLLAEDYPVNQKIAKAHLKHLNCEIEICENGKEATKAFEAKEYDLILMDLQMPEMDGYEATSKIRNHERGKKVPIVALTANADEETRKKCKEVGMNDFISKPFRKEIFLKVVSTWIEESKKESAN